MGGRNDRPLRRGGEVWSERENQSLPGLLSRLLTHEPSFSKWINDVETPLAYHNFADLTPIAVKRIVQLCQFGFLLLMVLVCRTPVRAAGTFPRELRRGWRFAAEYSFILVGMLLFSERTWKHHCVTLILPFAVLGYVAFATGFPAWKRRIATISLFGAAFLILLPAAAELAGKGSLTDSVGELRPDARQQLGVSPNSARELAQGLWGLYHRVPGLADGNRSFAHSPKRRTGERSGVSRPMFNTIGRLTPLRSPLFVSRCVRQPRLPVRLLPRLARPVEFTGRQAGQGIADLQSHIGGPLSPRGCPAVVLAVAGRLGGVGATTVQVAAGLEFVDPATVTGHQLVASGGAVRVLAVPEGTVGRPE